MFSSPKFVTFNKDGSKFFHCAPNGILHIWNTLSGILEHEYQPPDHLKDSITCIQYIHQLPDCDPDDSETVFSEVSVLGTQNGNINFYSHRVSKVIATLRHGDVPIVDLGWSTDGYLYSLASDCSLIKWKLSSKEEVSKVSCGNGSRCIFVLDKHSVIIGQRCIDLIKVQKKVKTVQTYIGHKSPVNQLLPVYLNESPDFFLSGAQDDSFVYGWSVKNPTEEYTACFSAKDGVTYVAASPLEGDTLHVAVATKKGSMLLFTHHMNGTKKLSPIKSKASVTVVRNEGTEECPMPIHGMFFCQEEKLRIIIVYSRLAALRFEKLDVDSLVGWVKLERNLQQDGAKRPSALVKMITPEVSENSAYFDSGLMNGQVCGQQVKRKKSIEAGLPMEERLSSLSFPRAEQQGTVGPPKGKSLTQLLIQGLHSKDKKILSSVLRESDEETINTTVRQLPVAGVVPLIQELHGLLYSRPQMSLTYLSWFKATLYHHMSHLSSVSDRSKLLQPFYGIANARVSCLPEITRLHARLDLMLNHIARHQCIPPEENKQQEALLVYKYGESSDEEEGDVGLCHAPSESEENWEELSELDEPVTSEMDEDSLTDRSTNGDALPS